MENPNKFFQEYLTQIFTLSEEHGTYYMYSESAISTHINELKKHASDKGFTVRYAMKANSNRVLLEYIAKQGLKFEASSFMEVKRCLKTGVVKPRDILYTTQEILTDKTLILELETLLREGLKINICSMRQLEICKKIFAKIWKKNEKKISVRIHPGKGTGESQTRDTGSKYSCFGVGLEDLEKFQNICKKNDIIIDMIHIHIGSGGDPKNWKENIDAELDIITKYKLDDVKTVNFGGGFKIARMPDEVYADLKLLMEHLYQKVNEFEKKYGRKLNVEIEPGNYVIGNAGYFCTTIQDYKENDQYKFLILDGGLECVTRPALYGSRHPFFIISKEKKKLVYSDFWGNEEMEGKLEEFVVNGKCCEPGDCLTFTEERKIGVRKMIRPKVGDYFFVGGAGSYCSSMSLKNYNSLLQPPEFFVKKNKEVKLIKRKQTFEQLLENEYF